MLKVIMINIKTFNISWNKYRSLAYSWLRKANVLKPQDGISRLCAFTGVPLCDLAL